MQVAETIIEKLAENRQFTSRLQHKIPKLMADCRTSRPLSPPGLRATAWVWLATPAFALAAKPVIIWASDPVRPGETVVVRGDAFGKTPQVTVSQAPDSAAWQPAEVLQRTDRTLKFILPATLKPGIVSFRIASGPEISEPVLLNEPEIWWTQGDQTDSATPGGWIRVFGLNLELKPTAKLTLSQGGRTIEIAPQAVDAYNVKVALPESLEAGDYQMSLVTSENHPAARTEIGAMQVKPRPAGNERVFDVTKFGATNAMPGSIQYYTGMMALGQKDSVEAIQKTIDAAGAAGGGVVWFPRGIYVLSRGLTVPPKVTLRGAGRGATALSWVDDMLPREKEEITRLTWGSLLYKPIKDPENPAHPFLIKGQGHFTVEDLAMYAVNHRAGIQSDPPVADNDSGHVKIRRVVMRLNRFINNQENSRHYTNFEDVFIRRWKEEPQRGQTWQGAIHLGGPCIEVTDCDIFSSMSAMVLNGASGHIARNRIAGVPKHWTILARRTQRLIFEENECLNGGISLLNVHAMASNDGKTLYTSNFSREIYMANNSIKDSYLKDRDGGFVSDFHAPLGVHTGWAASSNGTTATLAKATEGSNLTQTWQGAMVSVLDGKGAGQVRFMKSIAGTQVEVDAPWLVPLDQTSFVSISKTLYRGLLINNTVADAGNAVTLWGGGVDMIVAGNRSDRGGSFNQIVLCHGDQFIPGIRAQFLDNTITEGINWGAGYIFPRASLIGTYSYTPLSFERVIQKNKGKPVTAPDYNGPLGIDQVFRRNRIESSGCFYAGGMMANILFEGGHVSHSDVGVEIRETGGRWDDAMLEGGPVDVLVRDNRMLDVTQPYAGDYLKNAKVVE